MTIWRSVHRGFAHAQEYMGRWYPLLPLLFSFSVVVVTSRYFPGFVNRCAPDINNCTHLCLPTPTGVQCVCPNGDNLAEGTCVSREYEFVLLFFPHFPFEISSTYL